MPDQTVVHIVDDDESLRRSLGNLMESRGYAVRTYEDAEAFLNSGIALTPGCVILDLRMQGKTGLELQQNLVERECPLPILFLSGQANVRAAVTAMKKGAIEFLEKPVPHDELLTAVERAVTLSHKLVERAFLLDSLTGREREVHHLMEQGLLNKQIASKLKICEKTVEYHKKNIREKALS